MTFLEDNIFRTYTFKTLLKWGKIWIINVDLLRFVRIQVWSKQLLRYQVHNNLMANKLQVWKINNTQYLTWFDFTIKSTSTERNPFFIMRGKSYTRMQFEPKSNPYIPSLISKNLLSPSMYKATYRLLCALVCLFV